MPRDILITPNRGSTGSNAFPKIQFNGLSSSTISLKVDDDGSVVYSGTYGVLFNVTDSKDGLLHSVNDVSGLPILQVYSYDYVQLGKWDKNSFVVNSDKVGIGLTSPSSYLHINPTNSTVPLITASGSSSTYFLVDSVGKVGVGTTAPTFSLDVINYNTGRTTGVGLLSGTNSWATLTGQGQITLVVANVFTSSSTSNTGIFSSVVNNTSTTITNSQQSIRALSTWDGSLGQFATISSSTVAIRAIDAQVTIGATFASIISSHGIMSKYANTGTGSLVQFYWAYQGDMAANQFGTTGVWGAYYVADQTSVSGNGKPGTYSRWGVRIEDPSNNWFAGRVGIGSGQASPTIELQVNGTASISYIKMTNGSGTAGSMMISGDTTGTNVWSNEIVVSGSTSSTSATPQTLCVIPTATNTAYVVWAYVVGKSTSGATAGVGGRVDGVFRNAAGTLTSVGVSATVNEDFASGNPTFTLTTSGTNIILQVTGFAGQNITWSGIAHYTIV